VSMSCGAPPCVSQAIFRSRKIFQRMRNYCLYRISCTIQLLVGLFGLQLPSGPIRPHVGGLSSLD
jgi:hypothetical protein